MSKIRAAPLIGEKTRISTIQELGMGGGLGSLSGPVYTINDKFITARAAGQVNNTPSDPGPGTRLVTDTNGIMSISGGVLVVNGTFAVSDRFAIQNQVSSSPGMGYTWHFPSRTTIVNANSRFGLAAANDTNINNVFGMLYTSTTTFKPFSGGAAPNAITLGSGYHCWALLLYSNIGVAFAGRALLLARIGLTGNYTVYYSLFGFANQLHFWRFIAQASAENYNLDNVRAGLMTDTTGPYTSLVKSPVSGETISQAADAIVEFTWACQTGETVDLMVRRVDDNNTWIMRCSEAGDTITLIEKNAGVETTRAGPVAFTFTNGTKYRLHVRCIGQTITCNIGTGNVGETQYTSASFNQDKTLAKVTGFSSSSSEYFISWPTSVALPFGL